MLTHGSMCMQIAGMAKNLTIRSVPDEVRDRLAARASARGQSLQEFLLGQLVSLASRPDPAEWVAAVRARKVGMRARPDSGQIVEMIREDREGRR